MRMRTPTRRIGVRRSKIAGLNVSIWPQQDLTLRVTRQEDSRQDVPVRCRIDTPIEIEYYQHGGMLPYVLRQLVAKA
jgi:aconitate hydratase